MSDEVLVVELTTIDSECILQDQFKIRKKDEVFLRKILVMLESNCG